VIQFIYWCTALCDKVCWWLEAGLLFSPGTPVSSTNRTDRYDIAELLLKVALNTITLTIFLLELAIATKAETIETMINRNDTNGCLEKNPQKGHKHKKPEKTMIYMGTFIITSWCKTDIYIYIYSEVKSNYYTQNCQKLP
jgi:hypothetical protein